jgi:hypothetical protein
LAARRDDPKDTTIVKIIQKVYYSQIVFQPGTIPNPNGRSRESHNKRTAKIYFSLQDRGDLDPADYLSSIVSDTTAPRDVRMQAANMLMPYMHSKAGVLPAKLYVNYMINFPHPAPKTLSDIRDNILYLTNLKLAKEIDTGTADNLIPDQRHLHDSLFEELKLLHATDSAPETSIRIEGGLPPLPGTQIIGPSIENQDPHLLLDSDHGFLDPPKQPPVIDGVATSSADPGTEPTSAKVMPRSGPTVAAHGPLGGPVFEPNPPHATSGPPVGNQRANGQTSPASHGANGPAPTAQGNAPPAEPVTSEIPQPPPAPDSELRSAYLLERTLRFPTTPGLYVWRGGLYVDRQP